MNNLLSAILVCILLSLVQQPVQANQAIPTSYLKEGFVVTSKARFSPSLQRLMAERELKALPLLHGRLFYIVPVNTRLADEQAQIQYLEYLLRSRADEPN